MCVPSPIHDTGKTLTRLGSTAQGRSAWRFTQCQLPMGQRAFMSPRMRVNVVSQQQVSQSYRQRTRHHGNAEIHTAVQVSMEARLRGT